MSYLTRNYDKISYFEEGKKLFEKDDFKGAIIYLEKALSLDPKNSEISYYISYSYFLCGKDKEALNYIREAIEGCRKENDLIRFTILKIKIYCQSESYDKVYFCYKQLFIKNYELKLDDICRLVKSLYCIGNYKEAIQYFEVGKSSLKNSNVDNLSIDTIFRLSKYYIKTLLAKKEYEKMIAYIDSQIYFYDNPEKRSIFMKLKCQGLLYLKKFQEAEEAIKLVGDTYDRYFLKSLEYLLKGEYSNAENEISKISKKNCNDLWLQVKIYRCLKKPDEDILSLLIKIFDQCDWKIEYLVEYERCLINLCKFNEALNVSDILLELEESEVYPYNLMILLLYVELLQNANLTLSSNEKILQKTTVFSVVEKSLFDPEVLSNYTNERLLEIIMKIIEVYTMNDENKLNELICFPKSFISQSENGGVVCKGIYRNEAVAVKYYKMESFKEKTVKVIQSIYKQVILNNKVITQLKKRSKILLYKAIFPIKEAGLIYFVSPLYRGGTLSDLIKASKLKRIVIPENDKKRILQKILAGLLEIINLKQHLIVTSSNILLKSEYQPGKENEIAISGVVDEEVQEDFRRTPPEILKNSSKDITPEGYVFSFGVIAYELYTYDLPFQGNSKQDILGEIKKAKLIKMSSIKDKLVASTIGRALKLDCRQRIQMTEIEGYFRS